ncbi:MAG: hypothetical protein NT030_04330 [Candidatus Saganbacteria bacterium]|nr:hypothetical protein [Candidatus Saganbacteria bacterium]
MKITKIKTGFQRKPRAFKAWEVSIGNYQMSRDLFFVNASSLGATRLLLGKGKKIRVADRKSMSGKRQRYIPGKLGK